MSVRFTADVKLVKLDGRFAGYGIFKFRAEVTGFSGDVDCLETEINPIYKSKSTLYQALFEWCWENFGPSCSFIRYNNLCHALKKEVNKNWSWNDEKDYLYLSEPAATMLTLKFDKAKNV